MTSPDPRQPAEGQQAAAGPAPADNPAEVGTGKHPEGPPANGRRWVWMDRWDPGTWEMPSNPTRLQRVLAGLALVIVALATFYLPFKILGVF